jgi:hypothetical protein
MIFECYICGPTRMDRARGLLPTAHTFVHLRFADPVTETVARLTTGSGGLTPGRAGFAPAGRPISDALETSHDHDLTRLRR